MPYPRPLPRREFLGLLAALTAAGAAPTRRLRRRPTFPAYPFTMGVASGDPTANGVVLWTRLAPDPLRGGGMPPEAVEVGWEVASDERFRRIVRQGTVAATPALGHSVHVELEGLEPNRWYFYRFHAGAEASPVGRTRSAPPDATAPDRLRFAFASCQHYEQGYYTAYRHMANEDLDLVVHLGDYIYEYAGQLDRVRMHTGQEIETLEDYRNRYALYKSDADLIAAHQAFPWLVTWDDHEVDNNYAAEISERRDPVEAFLRRRANAYQAYYEHMPLRRASLPRGPNLALYRRVRFGETATFHVLDTRQYRSDQPCGDRNGPPCDGVFDPAATLLGAEQETWLFDGLRESRARWNVLAQQVMVAPVDHAPGEGISVSMDQWSGYDAPRRRLGEFLLEGRPSNPVVLTGDIHSNWVNDVKADFADPDSPVVGTEFVGTSISSGGNGRARADGTAAMLAENPFVKYYNGQRGYVRCEVGPTEWRSDYRILEYVSDPGSPIATAATFVVEHGRAGAEPA